jgi:hypothetical protein
MACIAPDDEVVGRALDFLEAEAKSPAPAQVQWLPAWSALFACRESSDGIRPQPGLEHHAARGHGGSPADLRAQPSADAMANSKTRGPRMTR